MPADAGQCTMEKERQEYYMALALELSKRAVPHCRPNPPVGCVLVRDDVVLATGFTQMPGRFHAEASALAALSEPSLRDISAFVTLEPCSFHGRTPSCALTLIERGVGTVYVALRDPDPRNNGKGIELLRKAGYYCERKRTGGAGGGIPGALPSSEGRRMNRSREPRASAPLRGIDNPPDEFCGLSLPPMQ
jgi:pyrimidine deaminase RibD-like protein